MAKFNVRLALDCRVDVAVEAESLADARVKALSADFEWKHVELIDINPVNATDEDGVMKNF